MRTQLLKKHSTKGERQFAEILKDNHIPFLHRTLVEGREVDFIVGKYAIEIDGHPQDASRNAMLVRNGYVPLHYHNRLLLNSREEVEKNIIEKLTRNYEHLRKES